MSRKNVHALVSLDVEEVPACILCREQPGIRDERFAGLLALVRPFGILRCPGCGLRWLSPRPTQAAYVQIYSDTLYFGGGETTVDEYADLAAERRPYFRDRLARIEKYLGAGPPLRILEVGSASGEFLAEARDRGHAVTGVEFSADARRTALQKHGLALLSAEESTTLPEGGFDAIHMNHVLEHMPDPLRHVAWCRSLLRPGGVMVVEVPQQLDNDLDRLRRLLGAGGRHRELDVYSLHHTYFFTPATARDLFERAGFSPGALATANPMRTPLWPPSLRHSLLRPFLWLADRVHRGGNIIEIYAHRPA